MSDTDIAALIERLQATPWKLCLQAAAALEALQAENGHLQTALDIHWNGSIAAARNAALIDAETEVARLLDEAFRRSGKRVNICAEAVRKARLTALELTEAEIEVGAAAILAFEDDMPDGQQFMTMLLAGKGAEHYGDCTKVAVTCCRCLYDEYTAKVRRATAAIHADRYDPS